MRIPRLSGFSKNIMALPWFTPLLLFVLGVIFFNLKGVNPSPDSCWYLNNALRIYENPIWDNFMIMRPVFPTLIAFSFYIFGLSVKSAFYVVRVFFVLNILLSYFIGLKMYNRTTGIVFSLLVLTSFPINRWSSYILVDNVIPFFILFFILLIYLAFEKSKYLYFFLSGVTLAVAFLVKEIFAITFLLLPLFLFVFKKYRTIKCFKGVGLVYLPLFIILAPGLFHILRTSHDFTLLFGSLADTAGIRRRQLMPFSNEFSLSSHLFTILVTQVRYVSNFLRDYIIKDFVLYPLFGISLLYSVYDAFFKKNTATYIQLISLLLFSPIMFITAKSSIREGQMLVLYFFLYFLSANFLINFCGGRSRKKVLPIAVSVLVFLCLLLQVFVGGGTRRDNFLGLVAGRYAPSFSFRGNEFALGGWMNNAVQEASDWVVNNISPKDKIICEWHYREALIFLTGQKYDIRQINSSPLADNLVNHNVTEEMGKPLFIWLERDYRIIPGNLFITTFERDLLKQINEDHVKYIIVTYRRNFFTLYFRENKDFSLLKSFEGGKIKIYKVNSFPVREQPSFSTMFEDSVFAYFVNLRKRAPLRYIEERDSFCRELHFGDRQAGMFFGFIDSYNEQGFWKSYSRVTERKIYPE